MTFLCFWTSSVIFTLKYASFLTGLCLEKIHTFYWVDILHFAGTLGKKRRKKNSTNRRSMLPWSDTTKIQKFRDVDGLTSIEHFVTLCLFDDGKLIRLVNRERTARSTPKIKLNQTAASVWYVSLVHCFARAEILVRAVRLCCARNLCQHRSSRVTPVRIQ